MARRIPRKETAMKCMHCGGEMQRGRAPLHVDREGIHVTLDEVPAWVCKQCGEPAFEEAEVDSVQAIVKVVEREAERLARPA
jgi:YgiT-type zinc finger domain-containing protein